MIELTITSEPKFRASVGKSGKTTAEALTAKGNTIRVGWWAWKGIEKGQKVFASSLEERRYTPGKGPNAGVEQVEYSVTFPKGEYPDVPPPDQYGNGGGFGGGNGGGGGGGGFTPQVINNEAHLRAVARDVFGRAQEDLAINGIDDNGLLAGFMALAVTLAYAAGAATLDGSGGKAPDGLAAPAVVVDLPY